MESKLILNVSPEDIEIALLEDSALVEYAKESRAATFAVGNIYIAKVKKLLPGLNAAFVEMGYEKEGFLHYLDLGANFHTIDDFLDKLPTGRGRTPSMNKVTFTQETPKSGLITNVLKVGQEILVQVTKEPISTKGPRLTAEISIAGRSIVLIPFAKKVNVSQKIVDNKERNRLKKAVNSVKPQNYGAIVRTVAEGKDASELKSEMEVLVRRWEDALRRIQKNRKNSPALILEEVSRAQAVLRDHFNRGFESIVVNDKDVYEELKAYIGLIEPSKTGIVKYYDDEAPIFDVYNITKQLKSSFGRVVPFKKGAYLVIDHTEALHVIDVNSGIRLQKEGGDQENSAFEVNMLAVDEVAHQMRLRDMGGIVIIDLIDMHNQVHKDTVYNRMVELLENDSAKHNVLPLTKFGLMQITRQRVRPVSYVNTLEPCPVCGSVGRIHSSLLFTDMLERKVAFVFETLKLKHATLFVHPYVYAYMKQGFPSILLRLRFRYPFKLKVIPNHNFEYLQYKFIDAEGNEVDVFEKLDIIIPKSETYK